MEALKEWALVSILSLSPMIFSIITDVSSTGAEIKASLWLLIDQAVKNFQQGEIFIYAITALAPVIFILYLSSKNKEN